MTLLELSIIEGFTSYFCLGRVSVSFPSFEPFLQNSFFWPPLNLVHSVLFFLPCAHLLRYSYGEASSDLAY